MSPAVSRIKEEMVGLNTTELESIELWIRTRKQDLRYREELMKDLS